ncbi:MAG: proton-translocating NADH-quinone oxidoreductase, chain [Myxococcales bacterium]|nr:proton-translocating NADH-quinone oxidoreductase, chain [Myxococcales bacterium]
MGWLRYIVLLPLVGAAINGIVGAPLERRFGRRVITVVAVGVMLAAAALAIAAAVTLAARPEHDRQIVDRLFTMISLGRVHVDFALALDPLSTIMILVITVVGALIHAYSAGYMADDPSYWRYFAYLNLFVFSMLLLVLGDSFLTLFIGWEGVGLCSYLLIGFWYREPANARAGMKAFIVNRVGDFGFLAGVALLFWGLAGSWSVIDHRYYADYPRLVPTLDLRLVHDQLAVAPFAQAFAAKTFLGAPLPLVVALLLFLGAAGKSAQLPLYVWLPDAMAGPTPVSALIHAATMVTAGVYLMVRLHFLFALSPAAMTVIATVGVATALFGAIVALFQYDLKRVLAYSTISQLGFMFLGAATGAWWPAMFHLVTHACFKACLFLGAGSVIHGTHTQDMREMGGLAPLMPRTRWSYLVGCWAIAGFPWAAGFYSKDEILARAYERSPLLWLAGAVAAMLTSFYMFRSYYLTFEGRAASEEQRHAVHESPRSMTWVLLALAAASIVVGPLVGLPELWSGREPLLARWLAPVTAGALTATPERRGLELALMFASLVVATVGWIAARLLYKDLRAREGALATLRSRLGGVPALVLDGFRVDALYDATFVRAFGATARTAAWFDVHVVDGVIAALGALARAAAFITAAIDHYLVDGAVNGVADLLLGAGRALRRVQTGRINNYVLGVAMGVVMLIVLTSWL